MSIREHRLNFTINFVYYTKFSLIFIASLICFIGIYILAVYTLPYIRVEKENTAAQKEVKIYLLTNGAHTDIVVPTKNSQKDWSTYFEYQHPRSIDSTYKWIGIGWGDKGFYLDIPTWDDLTFEIGFKAAFWLGRSAIHATHYQTISPGEGCVEIRMSNEQYDRLVAFVENSLKKDLNGNVIKIETDALYGTNDAFYEAKGRYSLFHTCNTWTNNALKHSGQRACLWTALDEGLFYQYQKK